MLGRLLNRRRRDRADAAEPQRLSDEEIETLKGTLGSIRRYAPNRVIAKVEEERVLEILRRHGALD